MKPNRGFNLCKLELSSFRKLGENYLIPLVYGTFQSVAARVELCKSA